MIPAVEQFEALRANRVMLCRAATSFTASIASPRGELAAAARDAALSLVPRKVFDAMLWASLGAGYSVRN